MQLQRRAELRSHAKQALKHGCINRVSTFTIANKRLEKIVMTLRKLAYARQQRCTVVSLRKKATCCYGTDRTCSCVERRMVSALAMEQMHVYVDVKAGTSNQLLPRFDQAYPIARGEGKGT